MTSKKLRKEDLQIVPSDPCSICDAHCVGSTFPEDKFGKEMVAKGHAYLMPDDLSRAKVGKILHSKGI